MKREKKFTTGRWHVLEDSDFLNDYNVCDDNFNKVMLGPVSKNREETLANCFLTAAAPDLLEALEWAIENLSADASMFGLKKGLDAIAKAYGETVKQS